MGARPWRMLPGFRGAGILLYAVALGSLAFLNTWDFPIYVGLAALAFGVGLALTGGLNWRAVGGALFAFVALAVLRLHPVYAVLHRLPVPVGRHPAEPALPEPLQPVLRHVRPVPRDRGRVPGPDVPRAPARGTTTRNTLLGAAVDAAACR